MDRRPLDRWTDTAAFRVALLFAGVAVVPVLWVGVLLTLVGGIGALVGRSLQIEDAFFGLVSIFGALGFAGYTRAHWEARRPDAHNVTATLLCLAAGVVAALIVGGMALAGALDVVRDARATAKWVWAALFAAANLVWAAAGVAWMQRLMRRYRERTGRAFDGLPTLLLGGRSR